MSGIYNKPLPPPPVPEAPQPESESSTRVTIKLERIISPLAVPDLHKLFYGAPQFFARSEGHHTGAPHPSVAFPWNSELEIRDLCDHFQIQDNAWSSATAWPHITRETSQSVEATKEHNDKQRAHFLPRCRERPNMLSMQGIERGTIGYQAALELRVADALQQADDLPENVPSSLVERRSKFLSSKDGLRPLSESTILERLSSVSTTYRDDPLKHQRPTVELYTELFTQTLFPPTRVTDTDDPYSLQVQIEMLVQVLATPNIWFDFSLVEWRIRLGQILWGQPSEPEDEVTINNEIVQEAGDQKFWLLLQILLSCELLTRLDTVSQNIEHGLGSPQVAEIRRFEKMTATSVKWSLLLARSWLDNIAIERDSSDPPIEKKTPAGWLATLTGAGPPVEELAVDGFQNFNFRGRYQSRQLSGLLHFARRLRWPYLDDLAGLISSNGINIGNSTSTTPAAGTPLSINTQRSNSYFGKQSRPGVRRGLSRSSQGMSAMIHPAGWLSNSYISGLVLPGECLSHLLISTLLENDSAAVVRLGEEANLYGGFAYSERSFWSTACIVGRILAAGKEASECMGWVSSSIQPRGIKDGWMNIDVEVISQAGRFSLHRMTRQIVTITIEADVDIGKPRIWEKHEIEHDSNVIGGADISSILPGDFLLVSDSLVPTTPLVTFESLDLIAGESNETPDGETPQNGITGVPRIQTYSAAMRFLVDSGEEKKEINFALTYDVQFVTAHPCVSSKSMDLLNSPASPTEQFPNSNGAESLSLAGKVQLSYVVPILLTIIGHPLHKAFTYIFLPLLTILATPSTTPLSILLSLHHSSSPTDPQSSLHTTSSSIPKVLIIDCTTPIATNSEQPSALQTNKHDFGNDTEVLARAMCAERGWNALISRRGRGCLACAVREAGALKWGVILRF